MNWHWHLAVLVWVMLLALGCIPEAPRDQEAHETRITPTAASSAVRPLPPELPCEPIIEYEFIDPAYVTCITTICTDGRVLLEGDVCPADAPANTTVTVEQIDILLRAADAAEYFTLDRYYPLPSACVCAKERVTVWREGEGHSVIADLGADISSEFHELLNQLRKASIAPEEIGR
jgi:hypothetical protein